MPEEFKGLQKEQFDKFAADVNKGIEDIKKEMDAKASPEDVQNKFSELIDEKMSLLYTSDEGEKLQKHVDKLETELKQYKEHVNTRKGSGDYIMNFLKSDEYKKVSEGMKNKTGGSKFDFDLQSKAAVTMTEAASITNDTTNNTRVIQEDRDAGIHYAPRPMLTLYDICSKTPTNSRVCQYTERYEETNGVGSVAVDAGSTSNKSDLKWRSVSNNLKKLWGHAKVARDTLDDLDAVRAEINEALTFHLGATREAQLHTGAGTSNTMLGFLDPTNGWATAFNAGNLAAKVANANYKDVLRAAQLQVRKGDNTALRTGFSPNYHVVSPDVMALMDLEKASDGHYVLPPFVSADNTVIKGIRVIESDYIDEDTFLTGDFRLANLRIRRGVELRVHEENEDDALNDLVTFVVTQSMLLYVKNQHKKAFSYGTFTAAISDINKPAN